MRRKISTLLVLLIFPALFLSSKASADNTKITNFYYYHDAPYYLNLNLDKIFFKLAKPVSKEVFENYLAQYNQIFTFENFVSDQKEQIINISTNLSETSVNNILDNLKASNLFEYVSTVYSMPEGKGNVNTLIGVENDVIIQFKPYLTDAQINNFIESRHLTIEQTLDLTGGKTFIYRVPVNTFSVDVANEIFESGMVNYSEPNFFFTNLLSYVPNDPNFPRQWSIRNLGNNIPDNVSGTVGADMRVDSTWNYTLGSSAVKVAMVDSGIDSLHEDLAANIVPGSAHDFFNNLPYALDGFGHGTCTSGIVAAIGNNSIGISGIAPQSKLVPVMIFNASGSTSSAAIINGMQYSWQCGAAISSNSWGGGSPISAADNAISDGTTMGRGGKGTIFCFATGNGNSALSWPSTLTTVISVGGMSPCNQRKSPSSCDGESFWGANFGTGIDIVAPCVKVYATDITGGPGNPNGGAHGFSNGNYDSTFNGTSSATPNCAGVCALLIAVDSSLRWDSLRTIICRTADKVGSYSYTSAGPNPALGNTWNNEMGYGKVNSLSAMKYVYNSLGPVIATNPLPNTENLAGPYVVNSVITSSFGAIDPAKTRLFWTRAITFDSVLMTNSSGSNWTANIPGNGTQATYKYFIKAADVTGRVRTLPSDAPNSYFSFVASNDVTAPAINYIPLGNMLTTDWPATVTSTVTDNLGVDSAWVKWYKNTSTSAKEFKLVHTTGNTYAAPFNSLPADIATGDSIFYRIFAQDNSSLHNRDSTVLNKFRFVVAVLQQSFSDATFPPPGWSLVFTGTQYWTREAGVGSYGTTDGASAKFNFWAAVAGTNQSMVSNTFSPVTAPFRNLAFDYAQALYLSSGVPANDSLIVYTSSDAGVSYTKLIGYGANNVPFSSLSTTASQNEYIPPAILASHWGTKKIEMPLGTNKVKFEARSNYGNNLYLDSIRVSDNLVGVSTNLTLEPEQYTLSQNYPNPFNPSSVISYQLASGSMVTLKIYDVLGKEIMTLVNQVQNPGRYEVKFDGSSFASGVYFYRIEAGDFRDIKRMMLIK